MAASCKLALSLLLVAVLAAAAAQASAAGGVPACGQQVRKITLQNLCDHDLPLTLSPEAGSHELFGAGFVLHRGTHASFPVCSWAGRRAAGGAPPRRLRLRLRLRVVQRDLHPAGARPRHHHAARCPAVGCGAGTGGAPGRRRPAATAATSMSSRSSI
ncbi:unnamed protein product [Urochloa humidicola]